MKDIIITKRRMRTELFSLLGCFIVAIGINLYAIIELKSSLTELLTSLGYVAVLAIVIYCFYSLLRLLINTLLKLLKQKK